LQGSYFDPSNNVDRERNRQMLALSRGFRVPSWESQPEAVLLNPKQKKDGKVSILCISGSAECLKKCLKIIVLEFWIKFNP
jgi:hypothetical protein